MAQGAEPKPEGLDLSVSLARANVLTLAIALPLVALMLMVYRLLAPEGEGIAWGGTLPSALAFLALVILGILAHVGIHGLAWACFGRFPLARIRFGYQASTLTSYAHALDPMPARAYRLGAVLPALVLGVAALNSEAAMECSLRQLLDAGEELDFDRLVEMSACPVAEPLNIPIPLPDMAAYDELLQEVTV